MMFLTDVTYKHYTESWRIIVAHSSFALSVSNLLVVCRLNVDDFATYYYNVTREWTSSYVLS